MLTEERSMAKGRKEIPTQRKTLLHVCVRQAEDQLPAQHRQAVRPRRAARSSSS